MEIHVGFRAFMAISVRARLMFMLIEYTLQSTVQNSDADSVSVFTFLPFLGTGIDATLFFFFFFLILLHHSISAVNFTGDYECLCYHLH